MQGNMTQLSCFFFHRTNYMYVCQDPFHDTFPCQLHTATRTFVLFLFPFPSFPFPFSLVIYIHTCMYVYMYIYIYITKVACRRISQT